MSSLHAPLILLGLLWITFGVKFYRTYRAGKLNTEFSRFLWLASVFGILVITLSGKDVERRIDALANGLPITFYIKFICALMVVHALYFMLRPMMTLSPRVDRWLRYGCVITIAIGLSTICGVMALQPLSRELLRYLLLALRDIVICAYMIVAFIPLTYRMWQKETARPMRIKHFAGLMFDLSYLLLGLGNILTFMASLINLQAAAFIDTAFRPALSLCVVFFIVTVIPHAVLDGLFWPYRWWLLRRLRRLKARITPLIETEIIQVEEQKSLDGRIYGTVIFILDHYGVLRQQPDPAPYHTIAGLIKDYPDYSKFIDNLAKLV